MAEGIGVGAPALSSRIDPRLLLALVCIFLAIHALAAGLARAVNESGALDVFDKRTRAKPSLNTSLASSVHSVALEPSGHGTGLTRSNFPTEGDGALVARIRRGDAAAFEILVRRYLRAAHALARSVVGRDDIADDVCQEAFLSALRSIEQCRDPERFRSWFMVIVKNQALTFRSSEIRRAEVPVEVCEDLAAVADPLEDLARSELKGAVSAALEQLTGMRKEVFRLHDMEGLNHREISRELGISRGASRVHLHFARRFLKTRLERDWLENV